MRAVIQAGGVQHVVAKGDKLVVNRLEGAEGSDLSFDAIAAWNDEHLVSGKTRVTAKVLGHGKGPKVTVAVYKRRKGYHKKRGHRQSQTRLEILDIAAD